MDRHVSLGKRGVVKQMCIDLANQESILSQGEKKLLFDTPIRGACTGRDYFAKLIRENKIKPTFDNQILAKECFEVESKNKNIRGQRADMIIYDCAYICPQSELCQNGKRCPYDKED